MAQTQSSIPELPAATPFLNSVCPGFPFLDQNVHYSLKNEAIKIESTVTWPITGSSTVAKLSDSYLNIARPPLLASSNESTTYVSLPFHITNLFRRVINSKDKKQEGSMHIAANVSPLNHDPFKIINLNPGCMTNFLEINSTPVRSNSAVSPDNGNKIQNPFNKLTTNFNKLLKLTAGSNSLRDPFEEYHNLLQHYDPKATSGTASGVFDRVLQYDPDTYQKELEAPSTSKLLISTHVNVLNIIAIGSDSNYKNTKEIVTNDPAVPYLDTEKPSNENDKANSSVKGDAASLQTIVKEYRKTIEVPLLRVQFRQNSIITALKSFVFKDSEPIVLVGLDSGEVVIINLTHLQYQVFDDLGLERPFGHHLSDSSSIKSGHSGNQNYSHLFGNISVTTLEVIGHPDYDFLVVAGYSNGEVIIINPNSSDSNSSSSDQKPDDKKRPSVVSQNNKYVKKVVGTDQHITYFKKFDLSLFPKQEKPAGPASKGSSGSSNNQTSSEEAIYPHYLVGHFKISNKAITAISSTIQYPEHFERGHPSFSSQNPVLIAIGCDDGFVRILDLMFTHNLSYGIDSKHGHEKSSHDQDKPSKTILTDTLSNYFNDGVTDVQFSPDFKFLCVVGKGDLIEIFKITYYNVNGLLVKNSAGLSKHHSHTNVSALNGGGTSIAAGRRSRSGTVGSLNSGTQATTFLSPHSITPSTSIDISRNESQSTKMANAGSVNSQKEVHPPVVKDIKAIARFKGHTNTVRKVQFVKESLLDGGLSELEQQGEIVYKLISCGFDGKIIIWEFDYKTLSKLKPPPSKAQEKEKEKEKEKGKEKVDKDKETTRKSRSDATNPRSSVQFVTHAASPSPLKARKSGSTNVQFKQNPAGFHSRTRSMNAEEFTTPLLAVNSPTFNTLNNSLNNLTNGGAMNLNTILNSTTTQPNDIGPLAPEPSNFDQTELVSSFYKSLYDIRYKRHYKSLLKNNTKKAAKFGTIFHPIIDDKLVPSVEIPLLTLDLSSLIHDGKIDGFHLDPLNFWCYGKNGDIFRYVIQ